MTSLVTDRTVRTAFTDVRETDTRTALTRGLAEYMRGLKSEALGGRKIAFSKVLSTWAEPEDGATYPAAIVYAQTPGVYDGSSFTPGTSSRRDQIGPGTFLMTYAEYTQDIIVEVWANDPKERAEIVALCEAAFNPVDFMYGFVLELPHHYNVRATYAMTTLQYLDSEEDAMRRYRRAAFVLQGQIPLAQVRKLPVAKAKVRLEEVGPDVVVADVQVT